MPRPRVKDEDRKRVARACDTCKRRKEKYVFSRALLDECASIPAASADFMLTVTQM
jgi:hypothetical protein